jgi:hypothetical protein
MDSALPPWFESILDRVPPARRASGRRLWRWLPVGAFLGGFVFDVATLRRPDQPLDMALLTGYLVVLAGAVVLEQRVRLGARVPAALRERVSLIHLLAQFLLGGLLSATVVLYARSGGLDRTVLFVLALTALMVGVEAAEERLRAELPRTALFALVTFFHLVLFVPVVTGYAGSRWPLIAGALVAAAAAGAVLVAAVHADGGLRRLASHLARYTGLAVAGALALVVMEATRILPPVPMAVTEAAVVRAVERDGEAFTLTYATPPWWAPWRDDDRPYQWREGDSVWCFTAVFAPDGMTTAVHHVWERWDAKAGAWAETDRIPYPMRGGRDGGWRGYTRKRRAGPGEWRVRVVADGGRELTRVRFDVVPGEGPIVETQRTVR